MSDAVVRLSFPAKPDYLPSRAWRCPGWPGASGGDELLADLKPQSPRRAEMQSGMRIRRPRGDVSRLVRPQRRHAEMIVVTWDPG